MMLVLAADYAYGIAEPVKSYKDPYFCNYAKVYKLQPDAYLSVRSGPGMRFSKIDRLKDGTDVYTCDDSGEWVQVFYSGPGHPCLADSPAGLLSTKKDTCRSGWAKQEWIEVIAG
jgi:hypothetical protein